MPYIALKAVKFDRSYNIGEEIPEEVIEPKMRKKLANCGILHKKSNGLLSVDEETFYSNPKNTIPLSKTGQSLDTDNREEKKSKTKNALKKV